MLTIETRNELNLTQLRAIIGSSVPVKIKNIKLTDDKFKLWNQEYLSHKSGQSQVVLVSSKSKKFDYNDKDKNGIDIQETTFEKALSAVYAKQSEDCCYYMPQCPIRKKLPALMDDLNEFNSIFNKKYHTLINLWIGQQGAISPLHYDEHDNFLFQVAGKKVITLFSPDDTEYLYANDKGDLAHVSQLDLNQVDKEKYPLYQKANKYQVELQAGDILYIPHIWWHQVETINTGISINYWFKKKSLMTLIQEKLKFRRG